VSNKSVLTGWQLSEFHSSGRRSDESLIKAIANGSQAAMRTLYGRHHLRVYRFIARLVSDTSCAEDLISEVFLSVWRQARRPPRFGYHLAQLKTGSSLNEGQIVEYEEVSNRGKTSVENLKVSG
jgi:hypothetical protein